MADMKDLQADLQKVFNINPMNVPIFVRNIADVGMTWQTYKAKIDSLTGAPSETIGVPGAPGLAGMRGAPGPQGPRGEPGVVDYGRVQQMIDDSVRHYYGIGGEGQYPPIQQHGLLTETLVKGWISDATSPLTARLNNVDSEISSIKSRLAALESAGGGSGMGAAAIQAIVNGMVSAAGTPVNTLTDFVMKTYYIFEKTGLWNIPGSPTAHNLQREYFRKYLIGGGAGGFGGRRLTGDSTVDSVLDDDEDGEGVDTGGAQQAGGSGMSGGSTGGSTGGQQMEDTGGGSTGRGGTFQGGFQYGTSKSQYIPPTPSPRLQYIKDILFSSNALRTLPAELSRLSGWHLDLESKVSNISTQGIDTTAVSNIISGWGKSTWDNFGGLRESVNGRIVNSFNSTPFSNKVSELTGTLIDTKISDAIGNLTIPDITEARVTQLVDSSLSSVFSNVPDIKLISSGIWTDLKNMRAGQLPYLNGLSDSIIKGLASDLLNSFDSARWKSLLGDVIPDVTNLNSYLGNFNLLKTNLSALATKLATLENSLQSRGQNISRDFTSFSTSISQIQKALDDYTTINWDDALLGAINPAAVVASKSTDLFNSMKTAFNLMASAVNALNTDITNAVQNMRSAVGDIKDTHSTISSFLTVPSI